MGKPHHGLPIALFQWVAVKMMLTTESDTEKEMSDEDFDKAVDQVKKTMEVVGTAAKALGGLSKSL